MRRKVTEAKKQKILKSAEEIGVTAAAEKYDVTTASIYNWRKRTDKTPELPEGLTPERASEVFQERISYTTKQLENAQNLINLLRQKNKLLTNHAQLSSEIQRIESIIVRVENGHSYPQ
jgi:transposase-like protein